MSREDCRRVLCTIDETHDRSKRLSTGDADEVQARGGRFEHHVKCRRSVEGLYLRPQCLVEKRKTFQVDLVTSRRDDVLGFESLSVSGRHVELAIPFGDARDLMRGQDRYLIYHALFQPPGS